MKAIIRCTICILAVFFCSCSGPKKSAGEKGDGRISVTLLQVNDVYEIAPIEEGKVGGMARVATLKKQYLQKNPNTFLVMAGDFVSPSVFNSLRDSGKAIRGKQMVASMNAAGMDIAIFGNHEFDIKEGELQERINESQFHWVASNSLHKTGAVTRPFVKYMGADSVIFPKAYIKEVTDMDGTTARIGFMGITLPFNKAAYVSYTDPLETAVEMYNQLKDSCDAVIAITHQVIEDDVRLAKRLPGLAMIIGGHEHDMRFQKVGNVYITKAHANARSAYVIYLNIKKGRRPVVTPVLKMLDTAVGLDPATDTIVQKWMAIGERNYASLGFDAKKVVVESGDPLDGREAQIRAHPTNLTELIVASIQQAAPATDIALLNAGAVRVDDFLAMPLTQYDLIRSLPFGGSIVEADVKGSLVTSILDAGRKNRGAGGFLIYSKDVSYDSTAGKWSLKNQPIEDERSYHLAMPDFLLTGGEANLGFLNKENPALLKSYPVPTALTDPRSDIRMAVIRYLEQKK